IEQLVCALEPASSLTGVVHAKGRPVVGAPVIARPRGGRSFLLAYTQHDGSFVFPLMIPGPFDFEIVGSDLIGPRTVMVHPSTRERVQIEVAPRAVVRGRVMRSGQPVA